jgi:DNA invertase Pin-like site-specific DNA recombinase/predicted DNA-binding transcriptional regulator AlpA
VTDTSKISASHRERLCLVYVRQSTLAQTRVNTESLERQYELAGRAVMLGWARHQVQVVDADLGLSGADAAGREGFQHLVSEVALGRVGLIIGLEASRLARSNSDWYQLLDLCGMTATLIADGDGIYDPSAYSDRLVLGLKGTISEAELHLIKGRLIAGMRHKAAKGELRVVLPAGYEYDAGGQPALSADEAVREAIATVFRRFAELGSARQVMLSLRDDGLELPRGRAGGRVEWRPASYGAVIGVLTTPCYAGAFAFGRTRGVRAHRQGGGTARRPVPMDQWEVLITGHHRGYITWEQYLANQERLHANCPAPAGQAGGAVREGRGLLQGLLRCGRCGRMMRTGYDRSGNGGLRPRYYCAAENVYLGRKAPTCQSAGGRELEKAVLAEVFAVLEPAALAATARALADAGAARAERLKVFELAVERARYEAGRARRQYDACEPENRLVSRTLEAAWEDKLAAVAAARASLAAEQARQPSTLTPAELRWLETAGADIRAVFDAPATAPRERKQVIRALISEITVTADQQSRTAALVIYWEGGASTSLSATLPRLGAPWRTTDTSTVDLIRRLAAHYDDATIASTLARQGRRTGTGLAFTQARVAEIRHAYDIPAASRRANVSPAGQDGDVVSITQAAAELGIGVSTIYRWLADGFIAGEQDAPGAPWRIRLTSELRAKVTGQPPDGWLPLNQAAAALGLARQTVLHKVQRGELTAVHVRHGRRSGLRIQVKQDQPGLFEKP